MDLTDSWARSLRAAGRSQRTVDAYLEDVDYFTMQTAGIDPSNPGGKRHDVACSLRLEHPLEDATRATVEDFLVWCRDVRGLSDATVARRYRSLQQFYKWAAEEREVDSNPMAAMKPPKVVDRPPPIVTDEQMAALMAACRGELVYGGQRRRNNTGTKLAEFEVRRDVALVTVLATTGARASEVMGLDVGHVNWSTETITVTGKGGRIRSIALVDASGMFAGVQLNAVEALDRYQRVRARHPLADHPALWLGRKGRLTNSGMRQILDRRCADAGIGEINPHRFRHTFAHKAKVAGLTDENLMSVAGWQSAQMLGRYGRSASEERAQSAHRSVFGGRS